MKTHSFVPATDYLPKFPSQRRKTEPLPRPAISAQAKALKAIGLYSKGLLDALSGDDKTRIGAIPTMLAAGHIDAANRSLDQVAVSVEASLPDCKQDISLLRTAVNYFARREYDLAVDIL